MSLDDVTDNENVKDALLRNFHMTERGFRKKFRYGRDENLEQIKELFGEMV